MSERNSSRLAGRLRAVPLLAFAACMSCRAAATNEGHPVAVLERCWYVVQETVVPVNLPRVTVSVSATADSMHRRVTFRQIAKPNKVVTEIVVTPDRADELLEVLAFRRSECAGAPQ